MEVIEQVMNLIVNNGIGVACVFYLIFFQHTTMSGIQKNISDMTNILGIMKEELKDLRDEIRAGKK